VSESTCANCGFAASNRAGMECRRYPPVVIPAAICDLGGGGESLGHATLWPTVYEHEFCGEWTPFHEEQP
jgi:hypothetical protein